MNLISKHLFQKFIRDIERMYPIYNKEGESLKYTPLPMFRRFILGYEYKWIIEALYSYKDLPHWIVELVKVRCES